MNWQEILDIIDSKIRETEDLTKEDMKDFDMTEEYVKGYLVGMRQAYDIVENEVLTNDFC